MTSTALHSSDLEGLALLRRGKVRDVYEVGDDLLIVATDRLSAFDVVLSPPIPDKGRILTSLTLFWFEALDGVIPNHLITADVERMPPEVRAHRAVLAGRSMLVKRLQMLPVECVARGFLVGSGWKDYQRTGEVCGHRLPPGLAVSARLDPPLFTPATKAEVGHDENISRAEAARVVGPEMARRLEEVTLTLYARARELAAQRGVIIADTKFEFGLDRAGRLVLGDEILTPDSSRFWDAARYAPGRAQDSFDKQRVRDWLDAQGWDHSPPAPTLPPEVVEDTRQTYLEIHRRLTGRDPR